MVLVLEVFLDFLDVLEDGFVGLAVVEAVGDESDGHQGALLIQRNHAAVDERGILTHELADRVGFLLGGREFLHQHVAFDVAIGVDLYDARVDGRYRPKLVVVHRVLWILDVQFLPHGLGVHPEFFEFLLEDFALVGLAVEALAVESPRHLLDLAQGFRSEDGSVLDDQREGHHGRAAEFLGKLVLGANERMVRPLVSGLRVQSDHGARESDFEGV